MQSTHRALYLGLLTLLLCACDFGSGMSSSSVGERAGTSGPSTSGAGGNVNPGDNNIGGGPAVIGNTVIATPSVSTVTVAIGSTQTVSISFNSADGRPLSGFAISSTTLPTGWSGPAGFSCASVSVGNGCVLNLSYAPTAADSGSLAVSYVYIDSANHPRAPGGSLVIPYSATTHNNVTAVAAPLAQIVAPAGSDKQSVSITFTSDDGNAATGLTLLNPLNALPVGWGTPVASFACAIVATGSGCQLPLTFAPTAATSGTLALGYSYLDASGAARTGMLNLPYSTSSSTEVIASVSPPGQINAVEKTGGQTVAVTFNTNNGKSIGNLYLASDLSALPSGWHSGASRFSCDNIGTGNGCQLRLTYAPTALASNTITLSYFYDDDTGTLKGGALNLSYAATTNDNVVATASPSGQINAIVGLGSQPVVVTFTTDDGRPATALELTSSLVALPAGWSSPATAFACAGLSTGSACQLTLTYAPPAADSGTVVLNFAYKNDAGISKTGALNIAYRATTDDNVVGTPSASALAVFTGSSTAINVTFTTDDGNSASGLAVTSGLATLPNGWSSSASAFSCMSVGSGTSCLLPLTYAPSTPDAGTLTFGFSYTNNAGMPKTGTAALTYTATIPPP